MRFKTVATFENYEVVEPTEPVKRIEVIDIRRQPVEQIPDKQYRRKVNKKKYDRESTISAIFAGVTMSLFVIWMCVTWLIFGY